MQRHCYFSRKFLNDNRMMVLCVCHPIYAGHQSPFGGMWVLQSHRKVTHEIPKSKKCKKIEIWQDSRFRRHISQTVENIILKRFLLKHSSHRISSIAGSAQSRMTCQCLRYCDTGSANIDCTSCAPFRPLNRRSGTKIPGVVFCEICRFVKLRSDLRV